MRVAEQLAHDDPAAGADDPRELAQGGLLVGDLTEHGDEVGAIDGVSG